MRPSILSGPAPTNAGTTAKGRRRGKPTQRKTSQLTIHREVTLHPATLPEGATLKGYETYVVQDLLIQGENTKYLRARYDLPEGGSVLAPLPAGVLPVEGGHFGANLGTTLCIDTGVYESHGWLTCLNVLTGRYWQANQQGQRRIGWLEESA